MGGVLRSSGVWVAVLCLAAVPAASAREARTVTLFYWGNEGDAYASQNLLHDFQSLHDGSDGAPRIEVIMGQSATINRTTDPQRLLCGIAGGDPPDVVFFDRFAVGEWAARGAFERLDPFLEADLRERPDDPFTLRRETFFDACWQEASYQGGVYAIPSDTDNRALYYNMDVMEKHAAELVAAGCVDPGDPTRPGPPRTWEQLKACTRIMTERDANGRLVRVGFLPYSQTFGNAWLYLYGWLNGGHFMSEDGRTCTLNDPRIVEAIAYLTDLFDIMGGTEEVLAFQTSSLGGELDPFLSGKIAMQVTVDNYMVAIATLRTELRFGVTLAPAPEGMPRFGWCGGFCYVIPTGARHKQEAWELVKYLVSQRAYALRVDALRQQASARGTIYIPQMSARRDITTWAVDHYLYSVPSVPQTFKDAMRVFVDAMPTSKYRPVTPVGQLLWNYQVRAVEDGIYKRFDPTDNLRNAKLAADSATRVVQAALDKLHDTTPYPRLHWAPVVAAYLALLCASIMGIHWWYSRRDPVTGFFRREMRAGYLFALPWFIGFAVFGGGPILFSLLMSFCRYDILTPPVFVGLDNYREMFTDDPLFYKALWNTVFMAIGVPLGMVVSLAMAMLLSYEIRGMAVYRTFFYLPAIMPAVAASILWIWIFNPQEGILNTLLARAGLEGPAWLQNQYWSKPALILMGLWQAGGNMIVWLAGLKAIPVHLYEAAELDGAGAWRRFRSVTVPMLSPYILLNLIMGFIGTFQIFTQAFIMTQGGPVDSTLFYVYALFNNAFRYLHMGYASAMAWVLFAIILVLTVIQLRLSRYWVHYESGE